MSGNSTDEATAPITGHPKTHAISRAQTAAGSRSLVESRTHTSTKRGDITIAIVMAPGVSS